MDFMNLNQAAHGDREFGYIQSRLSHPRKTVAGHVSDPRTRRRIGSWMRAALGHAELSTLKVARFGDNMRGVAVTEGDKVEAEAHFGVSVDTYGVNDLVDVVERVAPADVDKLVARVRAHLPGGRRAAARAVTGTRRCGTARRSKLGLRKFLQDGGFHAFTTNFEDLGGLRQLPGLAVQRLMADGYGFGGEGDWKTAMMLRTVKVMAEGLPGGTSFMEDYTYDLTPGRERILGAHMLEVCPSIAAGDADPGGASAVDRRPRGSRCGCASPRRPPTRSSSESATWVRDSGWWPTKYASSSRRQQLPNLPVACAVWEPLPSWSTSAEAWLMAGAPHHTVMTTAVGTETIDDFAAMTDTELLVIDADDHGARLPARAEVERRVSPCRRRTLIGRALDDRCAPARCR